MERLGWVYLWMGWKVWYEGVYGGADFEEGAGGHEVCV